MQSVHIAHYSKKNRANSECIFGAKEGILKRFMEADLVAVPCPLGVGAVDEVEDAVTERRLTVCRAARNTSRSVS